MSVSQQADLFSRSVAVRPRTELSVVTLEGDDQRSWLNGQVTTDVRHTKAGDGVYGLAVTVRGKIMADVWVVDRGERLSLLVPETTRERLLESFDGQIIMEDVEPSTEAQLRVLSVQGPRANDCVAAVAELPAEVFRCDELGHGGCFVLCAEDQAPQVTAALEAAAVGLGGGVVDDAAFELARQRSGRPRFGVDFDDRRYPQEAGLKERAVSFEKGCYLGQEVVCTLENRGKLNKYLVRLEARGAEAAPGLPAEIVAAGGEVIGELTSAALDPEGEHRGLLAMGYVKAKFVEVGGQVQTGDLTMTVVGAAG